MFTFIIILITIIAVLISLVILVQSGKGGGLAGIAAGGATKYCGLYAKDGYLEL